MQAIMKMTEYRYGMKSRPFSIACQPEGVLRVNESSQYHDELIYDRELTEKEIYRYELERLS